MKKNSAFVVIVFLVILVFFSTIVQQLSTSFLTDARIFLAKKNRCHARLLAISTLPIALFALCSSDQDQKNDKKHKNTEQGLKDKKKLSELGQFYFNLLCLSGKCQKISLKHEVDGVDAELEFVICAEEGKLNVNWLYDLKKKEFKPGYKELLTPITISKGKEKISLVDLLEQFFKKNFDKYPLFDLFCLQLEERLRLFLKPNKVNQDLAISSFFTTFGEGKSLNLILLNDTLAKNLGVKKKITGLDLTKYHLIEGQEEKIDKKDQDARDKLYEFCSKIDPSWAKDWSKAISGLEATLWKLEANSFLKDKKNIESLVSNLLSDEIEPKFFNVLIRVLYKSVEFSISVIVERELPIENLIKAASADKKENKVGQSDKGSSANTEAEKNDRFSRQNLYVIPGFRILKVYENFQ